ESFIAISVGLKSSSISVSILTKSSKFNYL
ncbi:MAG: hypothetical protein ACI9BN_001019, partial [Francisella sp.]